MSDKFSIDDILAEYNSNSDKKSPSQNKPTASGNRQKAENSPTMILKSLEQKKARPDNSTQEIPKESLKHLKAEIKEHNRPKVAGSDSIKKPIKKEAVNNDDYDDFKPSEPLFSLEQMRKIADERKQNILTNTERVKQQKKAADDISSILRAADEINARKAPTTDGSKADTENKIPKAQEEKVAAKVSEHERKPSENQDDYNEKFVVPLQSQKVAVKKSDSNNKEVVKAKPATIFGDIDGKAPSSPSRDKVHVDINTGGKMTLKEKILQHRFLFEELVKRDFKNKYKRTMLGVLWSVISPFLTFLIQYFVFGYLFRRGDANFVIYLLSGTLMFHFFTDATNAGMFSMYANAGVLSKIKVPKTIFLLSSNVAAVVNFMLTLIVYFVFMIACGMSFGPHLLLMVFPIACLIVFNIGVSYILSALFVFFRDIQYLYSIVTMLLNYMSAIFYYTDRFPDEFQFIFAINPMYRYIAYVRQLVIDATIPSLTSHLMCLGFAVGSLIIGYIFHKKTEKKFVYYY